LVNNHAPRHASQLMGVCENRAVKAVSVLVGMAAGIRLAFELLQPVWPYLLAILITVALWRGWRWWRNRW
jgi:hypothetical protein